MALGANRSDVMKMITRQGMRLAAVGVGIGLLLALLLARVLSSLLIGVSGYDVSTFVLVPTLLAARANSPPASARGMGALAAPSMRSDLL